MIDITLTDGTVITLYSSIKEIPIEWSKKFYNYLLQDTGIGNKMEDVDEHLYKLMILSAGEKMSDVREEVKNLRLSLFSMISGLDFNTHAFACLIYKVNGELVGDDMSERLERCKGLTVSEVEEYTESVKKNLMPREASIIQSSLPTT